MQERLPFEPAMIRVPAGPFLMGTTDEQLRSMEERFDWFRNGTVIPIRDDRSRVNPSLDREQPARIVTLAAFEIGRFPVTNAGLDVYYRETSRWPPWQWYQAGSPPEMANHPVMGTPWPEARAYADWLRARTGRPYRLPTEAEWEKAARGDDGRLWPWGNGWDPSRANGHEVGPGSTTPVGHYSPRGDSPYGCADMAGNVWEWCESLYRPYPYPCDGSREAPDDQAIRIARGGSFRDGPWALRCAWRSGYHPDPECFPYIGFRLAMSIAAPAD